ncbi:MAG: ATP synthase F0 subunit B [Chloroherpetonaceae bacterium]|nr:ATP synthase F0 subunit B [Chthonomonadaceae bacterium]MDW8207116.1 ATP synthase F0 subunit B [Chloroherpetonaceae bacterium]
MEILNSLGFDAKVWAIQIVIFLALWNLMSALFWKPYLAHLKSREQYVADAYRRVEETRREMEHLRSEYQAHITQIENEARARIQTAIKEAQAERERILSEARTDAETLLRESVATMEQEGKRALEELRAQMAQLALQTASRALGPAADPNLLRPTIEEHLARNIGNGTGLARN